MVDALSYWMVCLRSFFTRYFLRDGKLIRNRHTSEGFALQIVEGIDAIGGTVKDKCGLYDTCKRWDDWVGGVGFNQYDSGV